MKKVNEETMVFVNVYSITRHFGGHEEGGWWYNWDNCLESIPVRNKNAETMEIEVQKMYEGIAHGNIYSVLGGVELEIRIEDKPCESETKERPYYE